MNKYHVTLGDILIVDDNEYTISNIKITKTKLSHRNDGFIKIFAEIELANELGTVQTGP